MSKYSEFGKMDYAQLEGVMKIKHDLRSKIILTAILQIVAVPATESDSEYVQTRAELYKGLLDAIDGDLREGEINCAVDAMSDLGKDGVEQLMQARFGVRPDLSDDLFVDDLALVSKQTSDDAKAEMIFWLGVRLLSESRAAKADTPQDTERKEKIAAKALEYFKEVLRRDVFVDHWYSRFVHVMLREKPYEVSST